MAPSTRSPPSPPPASALSRYPSEPPDRFSPIRRYPANGPAQQLLYEAWDSRDEATKYRLCFRALEIFPFSVDAYNTLANLYETSGDLDQALVAYEHAHSCANLLWPELSGMDEIPWGMIDCRPYLRTIHSLALAYQERGLLDKAIELYRYLLRVNPSDNQSCGMLLFNALVAKGNLEQAEEAAQKYAKGRDTEDCFFSWGFVLIDYQRHQQGQCTEAQLESSLVKALAHYPFVVDWLLSNEPLPPIPQYAIVGSQSEALTYAGGAKPAWTATNGGLTWLQDLKTRQGLRPPDSGEILFDLLTRGMVRVELSDARGVVKVTTRLDKIPGTYLDSFEFPAGTKEHNPEKIVGFDFCQGDYPEDCQRQKKFISFPYSKVKAVPFWHVLHTSDSFPPKKTHQCRSCYKEGANLRCGRCIAVYYCSKACQRKDWKKSHKRMCAKYIKK